MTEISQPARRRTGLLAGILTGLIAAVVGAGLYAGFIWMADLIQAAEWQMTVATIAIGLLVGLAMMAARPASRVLPVLAALIAVLGAAAGTFAGYVALTMKLFTSAGRSMTYNEAVTFVIDHIGGIIQARTVLSWAAGAVVAFGAVASRVRANSAASSAAAEPAPAAEAPGSLFQPAKHQDPTKP